MSQLPQGSTNQQTEPALIQELAPAGSEIGSVDLASTDFVVPVLREEVLIGKVTKTTGKVRIRKVVHEAEQLVTEDLVSSQVEFERVPMNVFLDDAPSVRVEGEITIIPVVEEVVVVTKRLRLKEELRVVTRHLTATHSEQIKVRGEELVVERLDP